jgi:hypothetical protein
MAWGEVEVTDEVRDWLIGLTEKQYARAMAYIDLLAERGVHLGEPYTRQLSRKLRELRFPLARERRRITYYIASGRRIVLLTVFRKTRQREELEIDRANEVMHRQAATTKEDKR